MQIPQNAFIYINLLVIVIYLLSAVIGLKKGLISQLIALVYNFLAIYICWLLAPILANAYPLVELDDIYDLLNLGILINSLIYCVIIFAVLKFIYLIISPIFKFISKIPILGLVNRIGGLIFGIINATFICLLISVLLNTPIITNSSEVKANTIFKYGDTLSSKALELTLKHINLEGLQDNIDDFNAEETRNNLKIWLIDQGFIDE